MASPSLTSFRVELAVVAATVKGAGYTNVVYVAPSVHARLMQAPGVAVGRNILQTADAPLVSIARAGGAAAPFFALPLHSCAEGRVEMAGPQRLTVDAGKNETVQLVPMAPLPPLTGIMATVSPLGATRLDTVDAVGLTELIHEKYDKQHFALNHQVVVKYRKAQLKVMMTGLSLNNGTDAFVADMGLFVPSTNVSVMTTKDSGLRVTGNASTRPKSALAADFNFVEMGIGGLDEEFQIIFRKAFASRAAAPKLLEELEMKHARGMLLYGPPGCGKTLIARKIGEALKAHPPKIVNGPEILSKWVGGSEENIRNLFAEADAEQAERGDESDLHIIIFDEIDAICKKRGSTRDNTGVHDSVVNQLLSKIDGVNSLNNILLIGMTNRMDMIDDALLRPGRLEIHVEIGLPDEHGRLQILNIHTRKMREAGRIAPEVDLGYWAERSKNFTGAEIEGLVKNALQFALKRNTDSKTMTIIDTPENRVVVRPEDFERGFGECHPAFGLREMELKTLYRLGVFDYGTAFSDVWESLSTSLASLRKSSRTNMISCLLHGPPGTGKTAIAAKLAAESAFPLVKRISAESLVGRGEYAKQAAIIDAFSNAYKSDASIIIIDDIDRIMEYVGGSGGARFSNGVLQTLIVMCRRAPEDPTKKLFVVCTTSNPSAMAALGLEAGGVFNLSLGLERLSTADEVATVLTELGPSSDAMDDSADGDTPDETKAADDVFAPANVRTIAEMLTAHGDSISVKSLLRLADTMAHMEGSIEQRVNHCQNRGYAR